MMKLSRAKIRKIIIEAMEDATVADASTTPPGADDGKESEEDQIKQVTDVIETIQKAPGFTMKWSKINTRPKFEAFMKEIIKLSAEPMKGKEKLIKAALLKIANSIK